MIKLEDINKKYLTAKGEVNALSDINLEINKGEFVVVRGKSGCGKTTLLMTMAGILNPSSGEVVIDGQNLSGLSGANLCRLRAKNFGFVFQMYHLVPYLNLIDNVTLAGPAAGNAANNAKAREILENLDLGARTSHKPSELSGGERQRVALARALYNNPPILIADEPTGNLDEENTQIVHEHLARYHKKGGTVLLVTHDSKIDVEIDRELKMQKGKLL